MSLDLDTCDGGRHVYLVDFFRLGGPDLGPLWSELAAKDLIAHNAAFDLGFLARLGFAPSHRIHDTLLMARLLAAGTRQPCDLKFLSESILKVARDKTQQTADRSRDLTPAQP